MKLEQLKIQAFQQFQCIFITHYTGINIFFIIRKKILIQTSQ